MGISRSFPTRTTVALALFGIVTVGCGAARPAEPGTPNAPAAPVPRPSGEQLLAISAVPRLQPAPKVQDYLDAVDLVQRAGAGASFESATWSDLDSPAGRAKLTGSLDNMGNRHGFDLLLGVKVIDTTVKATPADLASAPFDSPELMRRFHALIDTLKPGINRRVRYLSIGNEVDAYLSAHPAQWEAYRGFYADAVGYVHSTLPGVSVGVTNTFEGARGPAASKVAELNRLSDVEILTYYPLGPGFVPRPPSTARADLAEMVALAGARPLVLQEVGYPSDARLSSSEQAQATFVAEVLTAWRAAGAKVGLLNWFALHDLTPDLCDKLAGYYGLPKDPNFAAYLCSLGLRRADGTPKPAWQTLLDQQHR